MSSLTDIVCLANSRKHGGHCVAGIELPSGQWVRPVSSLDDGRLTRRMRLVDRREPRLLDVLRIPLAATGPDYGFERENRLLLSGTWEYIGSTDARQLRRFANTDSCILHTPERHVTVQYMQSLPRSQRRTLELVETTRLRIFHTGPSENGGHKWHGSLVTTSGAELTARITDPVLVARLEDGHTPENNCLVTISLSMPYVPGDWTGDDTPCWKLIAGVAELTPHHGRDAAQTDPHHSAAHIIPRARHRSDTPFLRKALRDVFGFHDFRANQEEIVRALLQSRDLFAVMPTGAGKSLCYQLPAHLLPGTCIVVSPLISLMQDQVDAARANGLHAAFYNSALDRKQRLHVLRDLRDGTLDLLYLSPERLVMDAFFNTLKRSCVCLFAIDEAHCISEWGHDFRPDYLFLGNIVRDFPHVTVAAFTATATPRVEEDIIARLGLRSPQCIRASFDRQNLFYRVERKGDVLQQLLAFVRSRAGEPGIIYRTTRSDVESTAAALQTEGVAALPYHAGLDTATRQRNQDAFSRDETDVVVATIAFGMGIDKPNVRYVVHGDLPKNLESYYQETGRAGRDGEPAHCLLLYGDGDIHKQRFFIDNISAPAERDTALRKLNDMVQFASINTCRRRQLLGYFGEDYEPDNCQACDVCTDAVTRTDETAAARTLLAAIRDTGQRFGIALTIDIVAGANTARIRGQRLDRYASYGSGSDRPKRAWRRILDELIAQQCVRREGAEYPVLKLTAEGRRILRGEQPFLAVQAAAGPPPRTEDDVEQQPDRDLFEHLRQLRRRLAAERGVRPFVVFSDRTLREMCCHLPVDQASMRRINGVGEVRLREYGDVFCAAIRSFLDAHAELAGRASLPSLNTPARTSASPACTGYSAASSSTSRLRP